MKPDKTKCRSCGAPIEFVVMHSGKRMPLDIGKHPDGNILVRKGGAVIVTPGTGERISHFATCPNANHHRNYRRR